LCGLRQVLKLTQGQKLEIEVLESLIGRLPDAAAGGASLAAGAASAAGAPPAAVAAAPVAAASPGSGSTSEGSSGLPAVGAAAAESQPGNTATGAAVGNAEEKIKTKFFSVFKSNLFAFDEAAAAAAGDTVLDQADRGGAGCESDVPRLKAIGLI